MIKAATIDKTGTYRYSLLRTWNPDLPRVCFVMLNPSTADAVQNDPTIWRCIGFASRWSCGSLEVVNLFAYRATSPAVLSEVPDPIGPENDFYIDRAVERASIVIAAWGVHGSLGGRGNIVRDRLKGAKCLGLTKAGHPRHPLYVKGDVVPMELNQ